MKSVCIFVALLIAGTFADSPACTKQLSLCSCETAQGTIDLSPLASTVLRTNDDNGQFSYSYSPCADNKTSPCQDAMVCKTSLLGTPDSIGKSSGETFTTKNNNVAIEYPGDDNKTSIVILKCNQAENGKLSVVSQSDEDYTFQLESKYACVGGPASTTKKMTTRKSTTKKMTTRKSTTKKMTTKTSPKPTKTSPKTSPKPTKTSPKTSPKTTKTSPKTTPKPTKTSPKTSSKTTSKSSTTPKNTKTTPRTPGKSTPTTLKPKTTTSDGRTTFKSTIGLTSLTALVLICRQLFQ